MAGDWSDAALKRVIVRQFFARAYLSAAAEENVAPQPPLVKVRLATVIDELGAVPPPSVNDPAAVQSEKTNPLRLAALPEAAYRLGVVDSVAGIFDHEPSAGDRFARKDAKAMDRRRADFQPEARDRRINSARSHTCVGHR